MSTAFLTKIEIDYETAYKNKLRDTYDWHQNVWLAFPGRNREPRAFLTRLDEIEGGFRLLIFSQIPPRRPSWCPETAWHSKKIADSFFRHSAYQFSLLANPTKKVRSDKHGQLLKNSRRVALIKREDLLAWLLRKAEQHGFAVDPDKIQTIPRHRQVFIKNGKVGLHTATEFRGTLKVLHLDKFRQAAFCGIGPAKAFNFGMLCLAPSPLSLPVGLAAPISFHQTTATPTCN